MSYLLDVDISNYIHATSSAFEGFLPLQTAVLFFAMIPDC